MWPREFEDNGTKSILQPQSTVDGAYFETDRRVNHTNLVSTRRVRLFWGMKSRPMSIIVTNRQLLITLSYQAIFRPAPDFTALYLTLIRAHVPNITKTVARDHLELATHV